MLLLLLRLAPRTAPRGRAEPSLSCAPWMHPACHMRLEDLPCERGVTRLPLAPFAPVRCCRHHCFGSTVRFTVPTRKRGRVVRGAESMLFHTHALDGTTDTGQHLLAVGLKVMSEEAWARTGLPGGYDGPLTLHGGGCCRTATHQHAISHHHQRPSTGHPSSWMCHAQCSRVHAASAP